MTDLLDHTRREITDRLKELIPHVEEHRRLQAALHALEGVGRSSVATVAAHSPKSRRTRSAAQSSRPKNSEGPSPAPKATTTGAPSRRAGRAKGSGGRAAQALALIKEQPGISIHELAAKMGIKHNYLYRVLPALQKARKINKQGKGWHLGRK